MGSTPGWWGHPPAYDLRVIPFRHLRPIREPRPGS